MHHSIGSKFPFPDWSNTSVGPDFFLSLFPPSVPHPIFLARHLQTCFHPRSLSVSDSPCHSLLFMPVSFSESFPLPCISSFPDSLLFSYIMSVIALCHSNKTIEQSLDDKRRGRKLTVEDCDIYETEGENTWYTSIIWQQGH